MTKRTPVIGLTAYGRDPQYTFALQPEYLEAVVRAGGSPVLLPPIAPDVAACLDRLDGLILTGGGDLGPPGEDTGTGRDRRLEKLDPLRDAFERRVARHAMETGLPTLAICRGMQLVNELYGGTLHRHLPDDLPGGVAHRLPPRYPIPHPVALAAGSGLAAIVDTDTLATVSWHHQGIASLGEGLRATAWAEDGLIEAFEPESPDHPWFQAVQWHPEMSAAYDVNQQSLFDGLVTAAF